MRNRQKQKFDQYDGRSFKYWYNNISLIQITACIENTQ